MRDANAEWAVADLREVNRTWLIAITAATALASMMLTALPAKADSDAKAAKGAKLGKMTCQEFLAIEDVSKPKLVYWAEGYSRKGKPEDAVFDMDTTDRLVPVIVESCQKEPKASFWKKVKAEFKKVF